MEFRNRKSLRFEDDVKKLQRIYGDSVIKFNYKVPEEKCKFRRSLYEDFEDVMKKTTLDPQGTTVRRWNTIFYVACLASVFVDPLFLYLPVVGNNFCVSNGMNLQVVLTYIRSIGDAFYILKIFFRFHTAYVAPSSRVFGRGELVVDSYKIALNYLKGDFWIDLFVALPLPQFLVWHVVPNLSGSEVSNTRNVVMFVIFFQYLPRIILILPLSSRIVEASGFLTEKAWAGAAYNLLLFLLSSHVVGAMHYLLAVERQEACWKSVCAIENPPCQDTFFECYRVNDTDRSSWFAVSNVTIQCDPTNSNSNYQFGLYASALSYGVTSSLFLNKFSHCLWWGLMNLSTLGQNLVPSSYAGEVSFNIMIGLVGLVLFSLLIGNVQRYLLSTTARLEEWRVKRNDTEKWMHQRDLPPELKQWVLKYDDFKFLATQGVDEESLLKELPVELRRNIKRHLCYGLVRQVPLLDQMDETMLDAICERLKPVFCTQGTCPLGEGDPVNRMLFIIRGNLDSYTTDGGRLGFYNSCRINPGDFFGEELLTWALHSRPSLVLPTSTRTVKAITEVEAFALTAEDLKFVASQFRRMHSVQLRHKFRFHSHPWRTWAACSIQAAWRRYRRRNSAFEANPRVFSFTSSNDSGASSMRVHNTVSSTDSGAALYAAILAMSAKSGLNLPSPNAGVTSLQRPAEPDFSVDEK